MKKLQSALYCENPHAEHGFVLPKVKATLACGVEHLKKSDSNLVGQVPPSQESGESEYIVVGAHYDHLGRGGTSSLDRAGEENKIHRGADDNASGVGWVMELAASLAKQRAEHPKKFRRGVIFVCWSGEEIGLIGSAAFCEHPPVPLDKIVAYINADHGGPNARKQTHSARRRFIACVAADDRETECCRRIQPCPPGRSLSAD